SDQRTERVENPDDAVLPGPLRLDEIAERIELEIRGKDALHLAAQRCADRNDRREDREGKVGRRDERPTGSRRVSEPGPIARVITGFPEINLPDLAALSVFEDSTQRQFAAGRGADQLDGKIGAGRRPERLALLHAQVADAPHLQPGAVFVADINAADLGP